MDKCFHFDLPFSAYWARDPTAQLLPPIRPNRVTSAQSGSEHQQPALQSQVVDLPWEGRPSNSVWTWCLLPGSRGQTACLQSESSSAAKHAQLRISALLPAGALELRSVTFGLRITETKIPDEPPGLRDIEDLVHAGRIKNRNPTHADILGARRQPHHRDCRDGGIFGHFRHCPAPKSMSYRGCAVGKYRKLARRLLKPSQFEARIFGSPFARVGFERISIAGLERVANGLATSRILDHNEAPWLTQSHRWRETSDFDQSFQRPRRQGIGSKPPDITPPDQEITQAQPECLIEWRERVHGCVLPITTAVSKMAISMICSNAPATSPVWPPICRMLNHAMQSHADAASATPIMVAAGPRAMPSIDTPRRVATAARRAVG